MNNDNKCSNCGQDQSPKLPPCPLSCGSPKCKAYQKTPILDVKQKPIIWVLGGPGVGKGTICSMAAAKYGFTHISSGDLLQEEITRGSDRARCLKTIMKRGGLVPTDIVLDLIRDQIKRTQATANGYLIDDYPRDNLQAIAFEQTIGPAAITLLLDAPVPVLKDRLRSQLAPDKWNSMDETIEGRIMNYFETLHEVRRFPRLNSINCDDRPDSVFDFVTRLLDPIVASARVATAAADGGIIETKNSLPGRGR